MDIAAICAAVDESPREVVATLASEGLIRDDFQTEGNTVKCAISMQGILEVDRKFVEQRIDKVLAGMGAVNSVGNVMEFLDLQQPGYQLAFDLANEMQNRDLVKLLYSFFPGNKVMVEMTLEGVRRKTKR